MRKQIAVLLFAGLITACSNSKRENIEEPTELLKLTPTISVDRLWKQDIGQGEQLRGSRQSPAVAGGRVYAGDIKGDLIALDALNGKTVWKSETDLRFSSTPGIGEDTLVLGTLDGLVVAYNPDSGTERWRAKVSSEVISAPTIGRGLVIVRSIDGRVFAFSTTDGERRWVFDRSTPALTLRGNSSPVLADGLVLIGYDSGQLVALTADDGVQRWEQPIAYGEGRSELERMVDIDGELAYDQGQVFAAAFNAQIVGLSTAAGQPLWNREMNSYAGISVAGDKLFVSDKEGVIWALDRNNGASLWKQDSLTHRWVTTPVVQGSYVIVGDIEGYLHWFDAETGQPAARQRLTKDPIRGTPQVRDGVLYAQSINGELGAYRVN